MPLINSKPLNEELNRPFLRNLFSRKFIGFFPDDVQNLFSLMDFGGDGKIKYEEYMRATLHYRRLGMLLSIDFLPAHRKCLVQKFKAQK